MEILKIIAIIIGVMEILNIALFFFMVFLEKKKPQAIIAWMTFLTLFPAIGFLFYIVFGAGLSFRTRRMIKNKKISNRDLLKKFDWKHTLADIESDPILENDKSLASFCLKWGGYPCLYNKVEVFNDGVKTIEQLKKDLLSAQKNINIEYYIFANDLVGNEILEILTKKAKEGVRVKLLYDSIGSKKSSKKFFKPLTEAGGQVARFFPPFLHINLKVNYRNHRKIVVIDGKIAYTGGVNIRDDHLGRNKRLSPWRDTHIKIEGSGVFPLQNIFLNDWRYAFNDRHNSDYYIKRNYFNEPEKKGDAMLQVLSSGPENDGQPIKEAYIKMFSNAKKRIVIQTPYFIPDDSFFDALSIACASGVEVSIMLPQKPDKKVVYLPSLSYARQHCELGAKIYLYKGFIHSKTILVDDNKLVVGTCNMDNRSFALNFEDSALIYSKKINTDYYLQIQKDIENSKEVDKEFFKRSPITEKMAQAIYRLLSPIL